LTNGGNLAYSTRIGFESVGQFLRDVTMNSLFRSLLAVAAGAVIIPSAQAGVITIGWTTFSGSGPYSGTSSDANVSATLSTAAGNGGGWAGQASGGDPGGYLKFTGKGSQANGASIQFVLTVKAGYTVTLNNLSFNYDPSGGSTPQTVTWTWTGQSGGGVTSSPNMSTVNGWNSTAPVLSFGDTGITLSGGQQITITGVLGGGTGGNSAGSGNIGFDNFTFSGGVSAVPEPVHYALGIFGLVFVGTSAGRWYCGRMKRA
jgi:hypothetical protein